MKKVDSPLLQRVYDLLVIGGGINGAAIANVAADNGLSVLLAEKGDFASGTSSKSTKLVHGGLRYLENFEFDLVHEALKERSIQMASVPHLVKPLAFVIPVYETDPRPVWLIKLGVFLYSVLSGTHLIERHRFLRAEEVVHDIPSINPRGLVGGVMYFDAQMDDARLCLENVLSARSKGAQVMNYTKVVSLIKENGKVVGARLRDMFTQNQFEVRAKRIVSAAGPWTNQVALLNNLRSHRRIRLTKGVHIVYKRKFSDKAFLLQTAEDKRIFFVIPWKNHSLIGTTDTDYRGDLDAVEAKEEDVEYLFSQAKRFFPGEDFRQENIVTTFAGLRPLVFQEGSPSKVSRKHVIEETFSGLIYVMGGKYTTYRKIAMECVGKFLRDRKVKGTDVYPLYGSGEIEESVFDVAREFAVDAGLVEHLKAMYGSRYRDVLQLTQRDPALKERICSCCKVIAAQIVYAIEVEMARTAEDIIWRRLGLGYNICETGQCRETIQRYIAS